jgi:hypothetical protein
MINLGLKTADIIDLDNRPEDMKLNDNGRIDINASLMSDSRFNDGARVIKSPLFNPQNYAFYQRAKRSLYVIEKLINDDNN